jgi:hypothetical protein
VFNQVYPIQTTPIYRSVVQWGKRLKEEVSYDAMGGQDNVELWNEYAKYFRGALANLFADQVYNLACDAQLVMVFCAGD